MQHSQTCRACDRARRGLDLEASKRGCPLAALTCVNDGVEACRVTIASKLLV